MMAFWLTVLVFWPMLYTVPVAILTFSVTWVVIAVMGIRSFNVLGHSLLVASLFTTTLFTIRCLIVIAN